MTSMKRLTLALTLLLSGCWARPYDLVQNGMICVELQAPGEAPLRDLSVIQDDEAVVVEGFLGAGSPPDSVTITLIGPDRRVLSEASVVPPRRKNQALSRRLFVTRLEIGTREPPPKGSTLRIAY